VLLDLYYFLRSPPTPLALPLYLLPQLPSTIVGSGRGWRTSLIYMAMCKRKRLLFLTCFEQNKMGSN
jgi:hypothetical protein